MMFGRQNCLTHLTPPSDIPRDGRRRRRLFARILFINNAFSGFDVPTTVAHQPNVTASIVRVAVQHFHRQSVFELRSCYTTAVK